MAFTKITHAGIGSTGTVLLENLEVTGVGTFGGSVSVGGTLTYEDVTNIDSVGLITARNGIVVGSGITLSKDGDIFFTGIATGNGSGLTALNASNLGSGTVPTARLGSGTASSSTFLRGDSTFAAVTSTTINNNADNRLITGSGTANTLNGESGFTFNGSLASIANSSGPTLEITTNTNAADATLRLSEGAVGSTSNGGGMFYSGSDNKLHITCGTDSTTKRITINRDDGLVGIGTVSPAHALDIQGSSASFTKIALSNQTMNTSKYEIIFGDQGQVNHVVAANREITFATNNTERLRIDSTGAVIKQQFTATNTYSANNTTQCGYQAQNLSDTTNTYAALRLTAGNTSPATAQIASIRTGTGQNDLTFQLESSNTAFEALRITSEGRMGLKTSSPDATLHVGGIIDNHPVMILEGGGSTTGDLTVPAAENLQVGHWDSSSNTYTNRLQITTGTGNVTMPSQACMVFVDPVDISTVSNANGNNLDPVHFTTQHINQGGMSSSNTKSRITVPTAGTYLVQGLLSGSLTNASAGDGIQLKVKRNGSIYPNGSMWPAEGMGDYAGKEYAFSFSVPMTLAANDYVEIVFDNIGGTIQYNLSYGYFAVSLMF